MGSPIRDYRGHYPRHDGSENRRHYTRDAVMAMVIWTQQLETARFTYILQIRFVTAKPLKAAIGQTRLLAEPWKIPGFTGPGGSST